MPVPSVWIRWNYLLLKQNSKRWKRRALLIVLNLIVPGPLHFIWFQTWLVLVTIRRLPLFEQSYQTRWLSSFKHSWFHKQFKRLHVFLKLNLVKGYHQVTICKTAIVAPFGSLEFLSMQFRLKNASGSSEDYNAFSSTWTMFWWQVRVETSTWNISV